jgi:hypothetical protein
MDEIEFLRQYHTVRVLIGYSTDHEMGPTNIRNALLGMLSLIDGVNQRVTEMQEAEEDE